MLEHPLNAKHPVIFFINGYGDHYINLPALRALSHLFAGRLTLVCKQGPQLFCLDEIACQKQIKIKTWFSDNNYKFDAAATAAEIGECDLFISLVPWWSDSLSELLNILQPVQSVGFFESYTHSLDLNYDKHSAVLAFDVVLAIQPNYRVEDFFAPFRYPQSHQENVRQLLTMLEPGTRTLSVHMDTCPHKMLDSERWVEAMDKFLEAHSEFVALLVGGDKEQLDTERWRHSERVIPCYGLPLAASCCVVAESDFFVGVDSCMLHVADFARVPGVGLFGPTSVTEFGFFIGPHIMIQADGSMDGISASQIVAALNELMTNPNQATVWRVECAAQQLTGGVMG
jgi:hypothetical protein